MVTHLTGNANLITERATVSNPRVPLVIVVVVNHNGVDDTIECLRSLRAVTYPNCEVLVVDNGSSDGSVETFNACFPEIWLINLATNLGFTGGSNVGIRMALAKGADYVLLLNNDTRVAPDFLTSLVKTAEEDPEVGIVGPKIYYANQPDKIWFASGDLLPRRSSVRLIGADEEDTSRRNGEHETSFVIGCAMLVRAAVFDSVGVLDDDYFVHNEDLDFCYRAREAGWRLKVNLDARVWHKVGGTLKADTDLRWYYATRNRLLFISKNLAWPERLLAYAYFAATRFARFMSWVVLGRPNLVYSASLGCWDFLRSHYGEKR